MGFGVTRNHQPGAAATRMMGKLINLAAWIIALINVRMPVWIVGRFWALHIGIAEECKFLNGAGSAMGARN